MSKSDDLPRWVKGFGLLAIVLVVLFAIHLLTGGGATHAPIGLAQ